MPLLEACIAMHLGDNRRCRDRTAARVPIDQCKLLNGKVELESVNQQIIRLDSERFDGAAHRQTGCLQNIDLIDFKNIRPAKRPANGTRLDLRRQPGTLLGIENLTVVQTADGTKRIEDYSGGKNRAE